MTVRLRPETADDDAFVQQLVVETITEELGAHAWPEAVRAPLLELQCRARRSGARLAGGERASEIIEADGEAVGWLLAASLDDEIRIVEIMVAAPRRGQGVGSRAIAGLVERAGRKAVTLLVNNTNQRAIRLYERLGFRSREAGDVQRLMQRPPTAASAPARSVRPRR